MSNLGRVPGSPSLPLPWWCNPWSLHNDNSYYSVWLKITFSMPGRGASTVGTEHMPRNWDELNTDIFSKIFELNTRLSSIYSKSPQPPPKFTCGHSVQLAHTVLTTPWMSLLLWACSWLWAGLRVNRAFPVSAILLQLLLWGFWPRGGQREGSPRPGHQSPLGIWNASQLTCNTRSYHASVNLFQFHCIEHWHSTRRG